MRRMLMIFAVAALTLGGCVSHDFNEGARTHFRCDGAKTFSYRVVAPAIEIYASGATHRLEPMGDGAYRSSDGAIAYAESGGRVTLSGVYNGPFENCRQRTQWSRFF